MVSPKSPPKSRNRNPDEIPVTKSPSASGGVASAVIGNSVTLYSIPKYHSGAAPDRKASGAAGSTYTNRDLVNCHRKTVTERPERPEIPVTEIPDVCGQPLRPSSCPLPQAGRGNANRGASGHPDRPETATPGRKVPASAVNLGTGEPAVSQPVETAARDPPRKRAAARPLKAYDWGITPWGTEQPRSGRRRRSECAS
jgi:hypothetical protein